MENVKFFILARNMDQDEIQDHVVKDFTATLIRRFINPRIRSLELAMIDGKAEAIRDEFGALSITLSTCEDNLDDVVKEFEQAVLGFDNVDDSGSEEIMADDPRLIPETAQEKKDRQATNPAIRTVPFNNAEKPETCDDCEHVKNCELVDDAEKVKKEIDHKDTETQSG